MPLICRLEQLYLGQSFWPKCRARLTPRKLWLMCCVATVMPVAALSLAPTQLVPQPQRVVVSFFGVPGLASTAAALTPLRCPEAEPPASPAPTGRAVGPRDLPPVSSTGGGARRDPPRRVFIALLADAIRDIGRGDGHPTRGSASPFLRTVDAAVVRSMGPTVSSWGPPRPPECSSSVYMASSTPIDSGGDCGCVRGSQFLGAEGGDLRSPQQHSTRLGQLHLRGSEGWWEAAPGGRLAGPERICPVSSFQDGGHRHPPGLAPAWGLPHPAGSEGCVPHSGDEGQRSSFPSFQLAGSSVRVPVTPIRPVVGPLDIHQTPPSGGGDTSPIRNPSDHLFGRSAHPGAFVAGRSGSYGVGCAPALQPRLCNQLQQVVPGPFSGDHVSRFPGVFDDHDNPDLTGSPGQASADLPPATSGGSHNCPRGCQRGGHDAVSVAGSVTSTSPSPGQLQDLKNSARHAALAWESALILNSASKEDLRWWVRFLDSWNGRPVKVECPVLTIASDASSQGGGGGWGAVCGTQTTGGRWSAAESRLHINALELLAGTFAVQCFARHVQKGLVLLQMDNQCAVAYVNRMGGTRSQRLNSLAADLWPWCLARQITIRAEYIPGALNVIADFWSRNHSSSEWHLLPQAFALLKTRYGGCHVDLFATRINTQLPDFVSWYPDPQAVATDAFSQPWQEMDGYAFPPFCLIGKVLRQVQTQAVPRLLLVTPLWRGASWFPMLLLMVSEAPTLLPHDRSLLSDPLGNPHPLMANARLRLVAWPISGIPTLCQGFLQQCPTSSLPPGGPTPPVTMTALGHCGVAGVRSGRSIRFAPH
eukprot:scpid18223/ scgid2716/ 